MKRILTVVGAVAALAVSAAPGGKMDPVAAGFPAWQGVTAKNYILGREITPSDLRHRYTIVVELDGAENLHGQMVKAADVAALDPLTQNAFGANWETRVLPRDTLVLLSVRGGGKDLEQAVAAAMKAPKDADENVVRALQSVRSPSVAVYSDVTFEGGPETDGKRPFVYVMDVSGTKPLYQGALKANAVKEIRAALAKAKKKRPADYQWAPFVGSVAEPKYPALLKALEKGKTAKSSPLAGIEKAILRDVVAKDETKASEAQIIFDALNQTRSDLVLRIKLEARACPHRAAYDMQELLKYWPSEKKRLDAVAAGLKAMPDANKLAQIFCRIMPLTSPDFMCKNASDAKKYVAELNKMKKDLEKLKESKIIVVQNGALLIDGQIDELIAVLPSRVPEK